MMPETLQFKRRRLISKQITKETQKQARPQEDARGTGKQGTIYLLVVFFKALNIDNHVMIDTQSGYKQDLRKLEFHALFQWACLFQTIIRGP
jgi:hypothetical protein